MTPRPGRPSARAAIAATLLIGLLLASTAAPAAASTTATTTEALLRSWINRDRAAAGLVPLRADHDLAVIAGRRATRMADTNTLSHTVAGSLRSQLAARDVQWFAYAEDIGYSTAGWAKRSAAAIYRMWLDSPPHRAVIMSRTLNYVGVGLAYRSSNGRTFASLVATESRDHTGARARFTAASLTGDDVRWAWSGADVRLQTHTAGLRDFDVQYRVGSGSWRTIRNDTTSTAVTLRDRPGGRWYGLRVRATDRRGNIGGWTTERRVWVP